MTTREWKGGLIGMGIVVLGYVSGMALLSTWDFPSFTFVLVATMGFAGGVGAVRHRDRR